MLYLIIIICFILALLLEGSVLSFFVVESALPDMLLVLVMIWGFILGPRAGALLGLVGGLLQDVLFGSGLGYFALVKMLMGYGAGTLGREFYREQLLAPMLLLFVGTLSHELLLNILVSQFIGLGMPVEWTV
ncbi:MAG TPA: rod shape-determining protein MreD, partial [Firmicutes bacterium]|nr:rod shape-determining protein MreD [Bacillota bacterium]